MPCPRDTYQPLLGQDNEGSCKLCPDHSTTKDTGASSVAECVCKTGFALVVNDDGSRECACERGFGIFTEGVLPRCDRCVVGKFKPTIANEKCTDCPIDGHVTLGTGARSIDQCVCGAGLFLESTALGRRCTRCASISQGGDAGDGTNCTLPGATIEAFPVAPGYYRHGRSARVIHACTAPAACQGGLNVSHQCTVGHRGLFCAICDAGYHGGHSRRSRRRGLWSGSRIGRIGEAKGRLPSHHDRLSRQWMG